MSPSERPTDVPLSAALLALLAVTSGIAVPVTVPEVAAATADGADATIFTDGEELLLDPAPNQTIRGKTTLEPGTNLSVNVKGEMFLKTNTVRVSDNRTFGASYDMSGLPEQEFEIRVYRNETVLAEADGRVVCSSDCATETTTTDETAQSVDSPAVQAVTEVTQNRTASIKVLFGQAETVSVSVGGPSVNYVVNGTVRDRDGDGSATILFHTDRAGTDAPTLGVVDNGSTRVVEETAETSLDSPLAPASYDVRLYAGPTTDGELEARGRVVVFTDASDSGDDAPPTATATAVGTVSADGDANGSTADDSGDRLLGSVGLLAAGGLLAVVGIGVVLGLFRN
ncbi:BGTF surface domain-containing protein [Halorussus salinus]|uniref:BGTF surface domain-containing protein n=1 Tax=Halorussus salinus TaxID=1364935 RepID=UPI00109280BF|nr:BGTF surface domain-containing protein [Halorussus salinus]